MLAPGGSAVAQSVAALHLRPANVQNNKQLDARIQSRDINVRQLICSDGATLNCYGMCLMDNTSIIYFTAWGPNAVSIFESLGPADGDDTLCICLLQFQVQPTVDTSYPKLSELNGTPTTTVVKLEASQQNSPFLQDTAVLNLDTLLTTFEVLAGAPPRFITNVCGIVVNGRDEQDTSTGKLHKTIELVDVARRTKT